MDPAQVLNSANKQSPAKRMAEVPRLVLDSESGICWVRTDIQKGADLVNGAAWISEFEKRLSNVQQETFFSKGLRITCVMTPEPPYPSMTSQGSQNIQKMLQNGAR